MEAGNLIKSTIRVNLIASISRGTQIGKLAEKTAGKILADVSNVDKIKLVVKDSTNMKNLDMELKQ